MLRYSRLWACLLTGLEVQNLCIFILFSPSWRVSGKAWRCRIYAFLCDYPLMGVSLAWPETVESMHIYVIIPFWEWLWQGLEVQILCIFT